MIKYTVLYIQYCTYGTAPVNHRARGFWGGPVGSESDSQERLRELPGGLAGPEGGTGKPLNA